MLALPAVAQWAIVGAPWAALTGSHPSPAPMVLVLWVVVESRAEAPHMVRSMTILRPLCIVVS